MTEFLWKAAIAIAVLFLAIAVLGVKERVDVIEGASCPAGCRPMKEQLRNRPIPAVHSFAKPFAICQS